MSEQMHACEPTLDKLYLLKQELYAAESTDMNMRKINAIQKQIERHEAHKRVVDGSACNSL